MRHAYLTHASQTALSELFTRTHYNRHAATFGLIEPVTAVTTIEVAHNIKPHSCLRRVQLQLASGRTRPLMVKWRCATSEHTNRYRYDMGLRHEFAHGQFAYAAALPVPRYYQFIANPDLAAVVMAYRGSAVSWDRAAFDPSSHDTSSHDTGSHTLWHDALALRQCMNASPTDTAPLAQQLRLLIHKAMEGVNLFAAKGAAYYHSLPVEQCPPLRRQEVLYFHRRIEDYLRMFPPTPALRKVRENLDALSDKLISPWADPARGCYGTGDEYLNNMALIPSHVSGRQSTFVMYDLERCGFAAHVCAMVRLLANPSLELGYKDILKYLEAAHTQLRAMLASESAWITAQQRDNICSPDFEVYQRDFHLFCLYEVTCMLGKKVGDAQTNPIYQHYVRKGAQLDYNPELSAMDFAPNPSPRSIGFENWSLGNYKRYFQQFLSTLLDHAEQSDPAVCDAMRKLYEAIDTL